MSVLGEEAFDRLEEIEKYWPSYIGGRQKTLEDLGWLISEVKLRRAAAVELAKMKPLYDWAKTHAIPALENELRSCTHDESDSNYRPLGDTYGWCSACGTKVGYKENVVMAALAALPKGEK